MVAVSASKSAQVRSFRTCHQPAPDGGDRLVGHADQSCQPCPCMVIAIHSLRKTAINDAIRNGAQMHEVREFAGHRDIRTTELYFVRIEEDGEVAARRIPIRVGGRQGT
jgi:integrase